MMTQCCNGLAVATNVLDSPNTFQEIHCPLNSQRICGTTPTQHTTPPALKILLQLRRRENLTIKLPLLLAILRHGCCHRAAASTGTEKR